MCRAKVARVLVVLSLVAVGCRRGSDPETSTAEGAETPSLGGEPAPATGEVTLGAVLREGDQVAIHLANGTDRPVELLLALEVEQEVEDGEWAALEAVGEVLIRGDCSPRAEGEGERCSELGPLTQLQVSPWLGTFGDAQCACERCVQVPAGRYRIVARGCHGERFTSAPVAIRLRGEE